MNNCIGINNHSYFYLFIVLQDLYLVLVVIMACINIDYRITDDTLASARTTCLLPFIVLSSTTVAQIMFDLSLIASGMLSLFFTPFLTYLVYIQTTNFMLNQTTNTRFSKHRKESASDAAIAALAELDNSENEDEDYMMPQIAPAMQRNRLSAIDTAGTAGCMDNICGQSYHSRQDRFMRKYIHDPNTSVNQEATFISPGFDRPTGETPLRIPGSVGKNLAYSYGKRQMFVYGVEESGNRVPVMDGTND